MEVDMKARVVVLTPVLVAAAYADGDQLGVALPLANALDEPSDTATILSVTVLDKAQQQTDFDILFFNAAPATGANHAPAAISGAEMAAKFLGSVKIRATDYADLAAVSYASVIGLGLMLQGHQSKTLYAVLVCRGAPTFASTSDLVVSVGIAQD